MSVTVRSVRDNILHVIGAQVRDDSSMYSSRRHPSMHVSRGNAASLRDFESFVIFQLVEPISLLSSRNFDTRFPAFGKTFRGHA